MSYHTRLNKAFKGALRLPLRESSRYVLISDCHRGVGTSNDNFLKNQHLYFAALQHYFKNGYTYIELGDGDELWENRNFKQIIETHSNVFWLLSEFRAQNRLYMIYGNHDIVKKNRRYARRSCESYHCCNNGCGYWEKQPLFPDIRFYEGIILRKEQPQRCACNKTCSAGQICGDPKSAAFQNDMDIYLTHGHQAELLNSVFWPVARFLVRYVWGPLERIGILDPTSAAKNNTRKHSAEKKLQRWAEEEKHILITGHTHRPSLNDSGINYINSGSCVHPRCITCLEIDHTQIRLVKWAMTARADMSLAVSREILESGQL